MKNDVYGSKEVINWLLEPEDALVRYAALVELLGQGENDPDVIEARKASMASLPIQKIFAKQNPDGYWYKPESFYMLGGKYKGTVWNVILLAEMGADGSNERIRKACEFLFQWSQDPRSGGFAVNGTINGGKHDQVISCLTGNLVWSMIRFGMISDLRVQRGIDWITTYQRADDGVRGVPKEWPYHYQNCWGPHTCMMGVVKSLKALAEIPPEQRSPQVNNKIHQLTEFILAHRLFQSSRHPGRIAKEAWTHFGFPTFWMTDALEMLDILLKLGIHDERMLDAINLVQSKQDETGRWRQEGDYLTNRILVKFEADGESSKRITLKALKMLKEWHK